MNYQLIACHGIRIAKGLGIILLGVIVFILMGFVAHLCEVYPMANLIWLTPIAGFIAWFIGDAF